MEIQTNRPQLLKSQQSIKGVTVKNVLRIIALAALLAIGGSAAGNATVSSKGKGFEGPVPWCPPVCGVSAQ